MGQRVGAAAPPFKPGITVTWGTGRSVHGANRPRVAPPPAAPVRPRTGADLVSWRRTERFGPSAGDSREGGGIMRDSGPGRLPRMPARRPVVAPPPRKPMNPSHSRLGLAVLLAALAMFGPFSIDAMFPAFPAMAQGLRVPDAAIQQTLSVYLIAYAAMSLFHGPLSDAWGRRRAILTGTAAYALASIGCALAPTLSWLLVFRAVQGISAGVGLIVGRAIIRDLYEGPDAQRLMSTVTMIFGVAPAIAPIIGGWVFEWAGWHAVFWFLCLFGLLLWLACLLWLPETHPPVHRRPVSLGSLQRGYWHMFRDATFRR